jgi:phosphoglycolate phosphatase
MDIFKYKAIFFDLDGTLVDSAKDLSYAIDVMASAIHIDKPGLENIKKWIGNGTVKLVERSLTYSKGNKFTKQELNRAFELFSSAYRNCVGEYSTLFAATKDLLVKLLSKNIQLACITNKPLEFTEFLLQQNMISQFFTVICAGDNVKLRKPDAWPLLHAAKQMNVNISDCLMIGDSEHDIAAARNAGCDVCAVSYGYNHGNNIQSSNPDGLIDSFKELL